MTANDKNDRHDAELTLWAPYVDAYVDGTLDEKDALRLHLAAEKAPALAREIQARREFFAGLDSMPVAEPSIGFDQRILDQVPLERYRTAPRRVDPVLVLGHELPSPISRFVHAVGRGLAALSAAYVLVLAVSSTALQAPLTRWAEAIGASLSRGAADAAGVPVLAELAGAISTAYDALAGAATGLASVVGPHAATFVVGLLLGSIALGVTVALQRRLDSQQSPEA